MNNEKGIVHGYTPEDLDQIVREEVGSGQLDYNRLLSRMERVYRLGGNVLGSAIHRVCEVEHDRIVGFKNLPPENPSE